MTGKHKQTEGNPVIEYSHCAVVIRAYNEEKHIGRLLEGIFQQTVNNIEIILVDSGSTDTTVAIASRYPVHVLHIDPNEFSFGCSLNRGISQTQAEFVVIASAHVYPVYPDWIERLLSPFKDPQVALSYGRQSGSTGTHFSEHQIFAQWYPDQSTPKQANPFCNNANAAIRRAVWELHPYDETLSGLEDLEWAHWAIQQGHTIAYVAEAEIVHVHNETPRGIFNRYKREAMAFKRLFPAEKFSLLDFIRLSSTNITSDLWHATRQKVLLKNLAGIFWFRLMQFWGTYRGYRQPGPLTWQLRKTFYYPRGVNSSTHSPSREVEPIRYNESLE